MKFYTLKSWILAAILFVGATISSFADDLAKLEGKWNAKRKTDTGSEVTLVLEITKGKFTYRMKSADGDTRLYAEGEVKTEKLGPFSTAKFFNIRGGYSDSDLQQVDDDRHVIFSLEYNKLRIATGFDKNRDDDTPQTDVYTKQP